MKTMTIHSSRWALLLVPFLAVSGCDDNDNDNGGGDTTPPTATAIPGSGSTIDNTDSISILFSETMSRSSLTLTGNMASLSDGGVWTTVSATDDLLTVSPTSTWDTGSGETLLVNATDLAGNPLSELTLMYDIPLVLSTFQAASVVIGQADFTSGGPNQDEMDPDAAPDANTLSAPYGAPSDNRLHQADRDNNRVLIYDNPPSANDADADVVLGHDDFLQDAPGTSSTAMRAPVRTEVVGASLFVLDSGNHRVMLWATLPTSNNTPADRVYGQPSFVGIGPGTSQTLLSSPMGLSVTQVGSDFRMVVGDTNNHRVMIWNPLPATSGAAATVVLGQADFTTAVAGLSATQMNSPTGVWTDGTRIAVADTGNNRVLIWNTFPDTNGTAADIVVGQPDFTTNTGAAGTQGLRSPSGVSSNGLALYVADTNNSRVLVYNTFPTVSEPAANIVLGQPDFLTEADTLTQRGLNLPTGARAIGSRLYVGDTANNRVMVFDGQ